MRTVIVKSVSSPTQDKNGDPFVTLELTTGKKGFITLPTGALQEVRIKEQIMKVTGYLNRENLKANGFDITGVYDHLADAQVGEFVEGVMLDIEIEPVTEEINGNTILLKSRRFFIPATPGTEGFNTLVGKVVRSQNYVPTNPAYRSLNTVIATPKVAVAAPDLEDPHN